jgi:hypothetical protein
MSFEKNNMPEIPMDKDKLFITSVGHGEVPYIELERAGTNAPDGVSIDGYFNVEHERAAEVFAQLFADEIAVTAQDSVETGSRKIQTSNDTLVKYQMLRSSFQNWLDNASGFDTNEKADALVKFQNKIEHLWSAKLAAAHVSPNGAVWQEAKALWKVFNDPDAHVFSDEPSQ